jgi:hypothetical protein
MSFFTPSKMMTGILQKITLNSADKQDSIQFRINGVPTLALSQLRRGAKIFASIVSSQSEIGDAGDVQFSSVDLQVDTVSVSISYGEETENSITTITFTFADKKEVEKILKKNLKNQILKLSLR